MRPGVTVSDYLTGVFAAEAALAALYRRDARGGTGIGAVVDASLYGSVLRILEWTIAAYDRLGTVRNREGNRLANSAPLGQLPHCGRPLRVRRRCIGRQLRPALQCDGPCRTCTTDPRFATLADRAAHADRGERDRVATGPWRVPPRRWRAACMASGRAGRNGLLRAWRSHRDPHFAARRTSWISTTP